MLHVAVSDEIVTDSIQMPVVKPDLNKANSKLGVGTVSFSANCRYMYSKNGEFLYACSYMFITFANDSYFCDIEVKQCMICVQYLWLGW